ncbi:transcriptional regulator [Kordia periserrulae]|uniref:Transcriptional regulator n=1 Tax=Kordia periserrulae TaxID=701523 RepID=A0A2T6BWT1_9FLAO|nr:winged helix-turn-helix domain-containing protein [Kordia periserrulae]PTX60534.1 transcriptional regulator [Kordia periserrulae]
MSKKRIIIYSFLGIVLLCIWLISTANSRPKRFSEKVKVALRYAGNKLLLSEKDSTSLILPIKEIASDTYELSFQNQLTFEPTILVKWLEDSFLISKLPSEYIVEVIQCSTKQVAYSFLMTKHEESTIIPCSGRWLPMDCYTIQLRFTGKSNIVLTISLLLTMLLLLFFIVMEIFFRKKNKNTATLEAKDEANNKFATIGIFDFYPTQNKLVKQAVEINLSKKECELLQIFADNLNQVVTRDELTKKVWEDNGVIVGRSLDTYISKLRKKLKDDERIKITNVHGVGYKLELDS